MLTATAVFVVVLILLATCWVSVLITVLFSALIAYVLLPLTNVIVGVMPWRDSRPELSRGIAVGLIFVVAVGIIRWFHGIGDTADDRAEPRVHR